MGVVATLLPDDRCLQRVVSAVHGHHSVVACKTWAELQTACQNEAVHLAVVDLFADGRANFDPVRQLKLRFARVTLVAYVTFTPSRARELFDAGRAGFDGLLIADQDDSLLQLKSVIEQAEARGVAGLIRHRLGALQPLVRDAVLVAVTRAHLRLTAHRLAEILSAPRRTLVAKLAQDRFPPPQKLISWGRLIVAAQMLEDRNRSADSIARVLDFPSGSAFRNTCQRYLRAAPQEIRAKGGARFVVDAFLASVGRTG
ncbi:MAG TPA: helix-turn-helix domain-containing protein [Gemmatimonadaceae bacterium]|nr:helix-turn-helix domain-containing protein [Gemmatimonadaceae bacterium]